jgi:hypothetical protein
MGDAPLVDSRGTREKAVKNRGTAETEEFLFKLGFHPAASPSSSRLTRAPLSLEDWVKQQEQKEAGGALKDRIYESFIGFVQQLRRAFIARLKKDPDLVKFANVCEEFLMVLETILFTVVGMIGGGVQIVLSIIPSLIQIVYGTIKFLGAAAIAAYAKGEPGKRARIHVNETMAMLASLPKRLEEHFIVWIAKFAAASTEKQSIMIGELSAHVFALLAPAAAGPAAAAAGQLSKVTVPKLAWVPSLEGALSLQKVGEVAIVVSPEAAGAAGLVTSTSLMAASGSGSSAPKPKQIKSIKFPKGLRKEPTLKNAAWGPRPPGAYNNMPAEKYAQKTTGSKESLYVGKRLTEFEGTRTAEELGLVDFPGYDPVDRFLLDAKLVSEGGRYDIYWKNGVRDLSSKPNPYLANQIFKQVMRQGNAWAESGAAGIVWIISHKEVAVGLTKFFSSKLFGSKVKVLFRPP